MRRLFSAFSILPIVLALSLVSGQARADFMLPSDGLQPGTFGIQIDSSTLMPVGDPVFGVDFRLSLTPNAIVKFGDFITIYDIPGTGSRVFTSVDSPFGPWNASFSGVGPLSPGVTDSPSLMNVTFTYFGSTPINNANGSSPISLGTFSVLLVDIPFTPIPPPEVVKPLYYASSTTNPNPQGPNPVISLGRITPSVVPEPASMVLVGLGLPAAFWLMRRRSRTVSAA